MYGKREGSNRPDKPPGRRPEAERPDETTPATFGSRLRARAALRSAQPPPEPQSPPLPSQPRMPPGRAPDVTKWVALIGAAGFVVLFLAAAGLFVFARMRDTPALPTPLNPSAPTQAPATVAQAAATVATAEATTAVTPAATATLQTEVYVVQSGDTLITIADAHGISLQQLQETNNITDPEAIIVIGQQLLIPILPGPEIQVTPQATSVVPAGSAVPTASGSTSLPRSIYEGDLGGFYPLTLTASGITIHYQAGSFTDQSGPDIILNNAAAALALIEQRLGVDYTDTLDVYLGGALFAAPDQALRGRAFSTQFRTFVLYDGSGSPDERRYMLAHEMTHVVAWHTYGVPSTVMLSEGLATYTGQSYMEQGSFIPYVDFCRALAAEGRLPSIAAIQNNTQEFLGHIRSLYNYYTAACFVNFLYERGGPEAFEALYSTSNYTGNYSAGLGDLELEFQRGLTEAGAPAGFDSAELVSQYDEVRAGYDRLFSNPNPNMDAYLTLDAARLAVMAGDFETGRARLDEFKVLLP